MNLARNPVFTITCAASDPRVSRAKHDWLSLAVAIFLFLSTFSAFGQTGATSDKNLGSIHGTVTTKQDNETSALAGINVKLTPQSPAGATLSANTDEQGRYEFKNLSPGSYSLSIVQTGFKSISKSISLNAGQQIAQDLDLQLETVAEKVEVTEQNQTIATEAVTTPAVAVTKAELIAIPTQQERVKEVLPVTPGVVRTLDGKLSFKGADENQSLLLVNSARTTDPVTGSFAVPVPTDAVESFAVFKTPYDAGLGSFSGGLTTIETKPPDDKWNYRVRGFVPSVLGKNGKMVGIAEAIPGVSFGGPLLAHKILFSEVFQYEMKKTTVRGLPWPYDISKRQGFNSFSTLEFILSPLHVLTLTVNAFPLRQQHVDINALVPQPASNDLNQKGVAVALTDKYQFESGAIFSIVGQYTRFDSNAHGQGFNDMLITPNGWGGSYFNQWSRRGKELQFVPSYQFSQKNWLGRHEIRVGTDIDYRSFVGVSTADPIQLLRLDNSLAEQINFLPATLQTPSDTSVAEFVQDHWVLNQHWAVDLGARLSSETFGWSSAFAPRAGVAFSPGKEGKTVIRAGAGIFYSLLPLLAADFDANPTRVVTQYDSTGLLPIGSPITLTNVYVGNANPLTTATLPAQPGTTPRNFTWNTEVNHELRKNVQLRVGYIDSHTTFLFVANPFIANTPGSNSFLGLSNNGSSHYRELEATVHFTLRAHDQVNASYIWSRTRGDLNNLSSVFTPFFQPVIRPNVYGILPYDVPNRVITWGIFSLPWQLTFSPLADIHSGYPYSPIDVQQNYVGTPNGGRFNEYFSLNLKLYREFRVPFINSKNGKVRHIRLGVYSLNVTNHGNFNAVYNNVTSPAFGQFVGFLDRREGAIIDFVD
jgi:hypothetical protein